MNIKNAIFTYNHSHLAQKLFNNSNISDLKVKSPWQMRIKLINTELNSDWFGVLVDRETAAIASDERIFTTKILLFFMFK